MQKKKYLFLFFLIVSLKAFGNDPSSCHNLTDCCFQNANQYFGGIDYLYWKTEQDDMKYGKLLSVTPQTISGSDLSGETVIPGTVSLTEFRIVRPKAEYDSGFKVWLGSESSCCNFDVCATYTYMPTHTTTTTTPASNQTLTSIFAINVDTTTNSGVDIPLSSLISKWTAYFNQLDIDFSYRMEFCDKFEFCPHIGARGVIVNQSFFATSNYTSPIAATPGTTTVPPDGTTTTFTKFKQNFYGGGAEGGLWGTWKLGYNVSLAGHLGGAILYSKFKIKNETEDAIVTSSTSTPTTFEIDRDHFHTITPCVDYYFGLRYNHDFCQCSLDLHLGWEQHVYFDINRLQAGGDEYGNFSTQGLTAGLGFAF